MRRAMDVCFYALFAVLAAMLWLTSGNGHVVALLCIATGLFFAVHWCVAKEELSSALHDSAGRGRAEEYR